MTNLPASKHIQPQEAEKHHISVSQINEYLDCSAYYMFHRIFKIQTPSKSFLTIGKSVHKGIEVNYRQKMETKTDLLLPKIQEVTVEEFEILSPVTEWDKDEDPGKVKDEVVALATLYHTEVAPHVQPKMVEERMTVEDERLTLPVFFVLDLVDQDDMIRDTKTYGRTPSQDDIDYDLQLSAYSLAFRSTTGRIEKGVKWDCLVKTKVPKYAPLESTRNEIDGRRFINIANSAVMAIQNGAFIPNQKSYKCGKDRCPFWVACHRDF